MYSDVIAELAPSGILRAGINLANIFLVTGKSEDGIPEGVSPDIARAIADRLGVKVSYVPCETPGGTAEAIKKEACDIAMIADEPARAEFISFTEPYVEIEATYIVPEGSSFQTCEDVDQSGVRIAVSGTSAYDLFLTRSLNHAELHRAEGLPAAVDLFADEKLDALAGLRPALNQNIEKLPGTRILDGRFMKVEQAIGTQLKNSAAAAFLQEFVEEAKASGLIEELIKRHGVAGKLQVAS
ncbi:MAG: transporter substrate-binding domain-containing protein [Rhodospirillaceae bacterium]|jgi:polar amino acid transport system substrate-binding protein|nr:transporter substrate-binding domain-containing protein [Rhodospirillaceae bacterium]